MSNIVKFNDVRDKIIKIRGIDVILDADVACLYGVETKEVNQAVKNNPKKFPKGYIIELKKSEFHDLRSKNLTTNLEMTRAIPKAFTERGCYMMATILKGEKAIKTTIDIIDAFYQLRELQKIVAELPEATDEKQQKSLVQRGGEIISDLIGNNLKTSEEETSFEINLAMVKFKHTVKRKS